VADDLVVRAIAVVAIRPRASRFWAVLDVGVKEPNRDLPSDDHGFSLYRDETNIQSWSTLTASKRTRSFHPPDSKACL
jgi:hypothetical protein